MNNALYLNGSKTAYPFAVATHYSFDAGQLHLSHTRNPIWNFGIQETFDFIGKVWKDSVQLKAKFDFPKAVTDAFDAFEDD